MIPVDDPTDPRLDVFMGLRDHQLRQARERPGGDMAGSFIGEGDVVIARALAAGHQLESVLVDANRTKGLPELPAHATVLAGGAKVLQAVAGRKELRDPIACFIRPPSNDPVDLLRRAKTVLVTEGVNNPTNMGVILRCAAGLGVDAVLVDASSCDPLYRRAVRVSMGEVFAIPHARIGSLGDLSESGGLAMLAQLGFLRLALTPSTTADDLGDLQLDRDQKCAVVIGAEGPGLSDDVLAACDRRLRIVMHAGVDSINVGTAAAIAFFAVGNARR